MQKDCRSWLQISSDMRRIYLTVDTECHDIQKLNQYIYGNKGKESYGLPKILKVCKELNVPLNVFLDVCECKRYGDKYIQDIVDLVHSYGQPIFFHFHPNFLSGDDSKSFLWQYSEGEQKKLLEDGVKIYRQFCGEQDKLIFRAGRYGVNELTFNTLKSLAQEVLDLSYFSHSQKMCKLSTKNLNTLNVPTQFNGVILLPNTTYVGFRYFGKFHVFILNVAQTTYNEFSRFIRKTELNEVVYTMHSWDFIRKWFFLDKYIQGDKTVLRKFRKCVKVARKNGFEFANLNDFEYVPEQKDELVDLCCGAKDKVLGLWNNFVRFYGIGRLTKKYFMAYMVLFFLALLLLIGLITVLAL